jgi:PAS domain S-box-containing protein
MCLLTAVTAVLMLPQCAAASERHFSILAKGISDCALYMLDAQGRVANWNIGAARLKGYAEAEVIGSPCRVSTPRKIERGARQMRRSLRPPPGSSLTEVTRQALEARVG